MTTERRIFILTYVNDSPYHMNLEHWIRPDPKGIMAILRNPDMSWLKEKQFYIWSAVIGQPIQKSYYTHVSDFPAKKSKTKSIVPNSRNLEKAMVLDKSVPFDLGDNDLYNCTSCDIVHEVKKSDKDTWDGQCYNCHRNIKSDKLTEDD